MLPSPPQNLSYNIGRFGTTETLFFAASRKTSIFKAFRQVFQKNLLSAVLRYEYF
jgi:hypothetical protein